MDSGPDIRPTKSEEKSKRTLRVAAWNIRRDPFGKERQIETFILNNDIDVIFLLETDVKHFTRTFFCKLHTYPTGVNGWQ